MPGQRTGPGSPPRGPLDRAARRAAAPSGEASTPAAHSTVGCPRAPRRHPPPPPSTPWPSIAVTRVPVRTSTCRRSSARCAAADSFGGCAASAVACLEQEHADLRRIDRAEVVGAASPGRSRRARPPARRPVGPAPTTTNVSHSRCATGSASRSAASNASEDPAPDLERVLDRLEPRRGVRPLRCRSTSAWRPSATIR